MTCLATQPIIKVDFFQRKDGQEIMNSLYFRKPTTWSTAQAGSVLADLWDWWRTELAAMLSNQIQLVAMRATDLTSASGFVLDYVGPLGPASGAGAAESLPSNVAMCVSFRTGLRGRANRGRVYLAGLVDAAVTQNTWNSPQVVDILAAFESMAVSMVTNHSAAHVVYSCTEGGGSGIEVGAGVPVVEYLVNPIVASQRRRLPGRGR